MPSFDNTDRTIDQQIQAVMRALGQTGGAGGGSALVSTIPTNFDLGRTRAPSTGMFGDINIDVPDQAYEASRIRDEEGNIADIFRDIFRGMGRNDLLDTDSELFQILAETTSAGQPAALPDDDRLTGLSQENRAALLEAIRRYNEQLEEDTNIFEDTVAEDTTVVDDAEQEQEEESIWDRIRGWWNNQTSSTTATRGGPRGGGAMPFPVPVLELRLI